MVPLFIFYDVNWNIDIDCRMADGVQSVSTAPCKEEGNHECLGSDGKHDKGRRY